MMAIQCRVDNLGSRMGATWKFSALHERDAGCMIAPVRMLIPIIDQDLRSFGLGRVGLDRKPRILGGETVLRVQPRCHSLFVICSSVAGLPLPSVYQEVHELFPHAQFCETTCER